MATSDHQVLLWGGLGVAVVAGVALYRKNQAAAAATAAAAPKSPYPAITSPGYKPPATAASSPSSLYTPPIVTPPAPVIVTPPAPVIVTPPAPAVGQSAADANAAFTQSMASAHAMQRQDFERGAADLAARVAAGQIAPGSAEYRSAFEYLSNLTGGVATQAGEAAKLTAAGLPAPG